MSTSPLIPNIPGQIDDLRRLTQVADQPVTVEGRGLLALLEEVWFWRESAAAMIGVACAELKVQLDTAGPEDPITGRVAGLVGGLRQDLEDALDGTFHDPCESCGARLVPGQPVIAFDDVGEVHAGCAGASEVDIQAGRMTVPFDAIDTEDMEPAAVERLRADPHVNITTRSRLYADTAALRRAVDRATAALSTFREAEAKADAAVEAEADQ